MLKPPKGIAPAFDVVVCVLNICVSDLEPITSEAAPTLGPPLPSYRLAELVDLNAGPEFQLHGFNIRRVEGPDDLDLICRFRHEVYQAEGLIADHAFPGGLLTDEFDAAAEHIVAYSKRGEIAGAMRVSTPGPNGLPTQKVFNLQVADILRDGVIDIGKFAIARKYRARLLLPFLKAAIESALTHRASSIIAFFPEKLARTYSELGCPCAVLPELPLVDRILQNRAPLSPYFEQESVLPRHFSVRQLLQGLDLRLPSYLDRFSPDSEHRIGRQQARVD